MEATLNGAFDATLCLLLVTVAWAALRGEGDRSVVLFLAFGFLMALAWVRRGAPDLALAEAAVGAGVTAALLFGLLARLQRGEHD